MRRRSARLAVPALALTAALLAIAAVLGTAGATAKVEVPFATQFANNTRGGVAVAANTLMSCPEAAANCLESRAGTATGAALNNNAYGMERVDVDTDPTTFDSSSATLSLPAGAAVQFAGLYYGGRTSKGALGGVEAPNPAARGTVLMRAPGALGYSPLSATVFDSSAITNAYVGFVDVTAQVAAAGSGEYTVANVQSGTGEDRYAGWSLIVVYSDPASPPRSIRVFDGLASIVANEAPLSIPVTGLETPLAGAVNAEVGLVAYEGDRGAAGDRLSLGGQNLSDAANPANNVFNSSISVAGNNVTTKNPDYVNQLGFDADVIGASGFLANGARETTLEESTSLDQYLTQAIVVAVELDPSVLEPVPPPTSSAGSTTPTAAEPEKEPAHHGKGGGGGNGGKAAPGQGTATPTLDISAPEGVVRPTAVVPLALVVGAPATVPLHNLQVCNTLGPGLTRLRATGASGKGDSVCWHLAKLGAGKRHRFTTTVQVDATGRGTLFSRTVVSARGARTLRRTTRIHARPLPATACGSSLRGAAPGAIRARC
ncbi:MAG: hypothetical protein JSS68_05290 [Actinobacteria bacterium]|nr:hypothetical protein [Actinomycetota bacterium]